MKCPNCGSENPEDKKFCGDCGAELVPQSTIHGQKPGSVSYSWMVADWKIRWAAVGFVGIFMGVLFGIVGQLTGQDSICLYGMLFFLLGLLGAFVTYLNFKKK